LFFSWKLFKSPPKKPACLSTSLVVHIRFWKLVFSMGLQNKFQEKTWSGKQKTRPIPVLWNPLTQIFIFIFTSCVTSPFSLETFSLGKLYLIHRKMHAFN
jgi:hypothetical protein